MILECNCRIMPNSTRLEQSETMHFTLFSAPIVQLFPAD